MEDLHRRFSQIRTRIQAAAARVERNPEGITLIAVSKTVDCDTAQQAFDLGIRDFGENRVQELSIKRQAIPEARWHMIGRLQTNKVKDVVGQACMIHSMDRWNLAEEINKRALILNVQVPVLLEVNVGGEEQKAGIEPASVRPFLESVGELSGLSVLGFMTMAPLSLEVEQTRPVFKELKQMFDHLSHERFNNVELKYLSMGMSQDFEIAVEEGANMVRIGSALFA